jgi:hypothetical protein
MLTLLRIALIVLTVAVAMPATAQDKGISTMDFLRQKVQADQCPVKVIPCDGWSTAGLNVPKSRLETHAWV